MKYNELLPSEHLKNYIKCFYDHQCDDSFSYFSTAEIFPKLFFRYCGETTEIFQDDCTKKLSDAAFHGQRSKWQQFIFEKKFASFGVHFYPHAIPTIFNLPATLLQNQLVDLESLLGTEGERLKDKIMLANNFLERKKIIEEFVMSKLLLNHTEEKPIFKAISTIIQNKGQVKIKQLANESYISERQFERQFSKYAGLNPKLFARIVRFKHTIEIATSKTDSEQNLTQIAYDCGFYDQSHFIHEFKVFSGFKPNSFFSAKSPVTILST